MDPLLFLLFVIGVQGAESVRTLSNVSVQRRGSVSIPCFYDQKYRDKFKYWCKGGNWDFCSTIARSDSPLSSGDVSITDDPAQLVFTVTMRNLQRSDSGYYWCGVDLRNAVDDGAYLYLKVTAGEEGGSVSIQCHYGDSLRTSVKMWCSFSERSPCLTPGGTGMSQHASVQISDNRIGAFTVTVRGLERKDTGWYFCSAGEEQLPVHITVTQRVTQRAVTQRVTTSTQLIPQHLESHHNLGRSPQTRDTDQSEHRPRFSLSLVSSWEVLDTLLKSALAVVYITCTIIAAVKTWTYCKQRRDGAPEYDGGMKRREDGYTDSVTEISARK
ncbi:hypothetical protein JZ751_013879 [Albula glossodonta]|uniref:Ig-like domain-containing protein n=1 Tax=Albula glossodonta TaxID=121402 RepID=A0A8T2MYK2_9TELE|nr:hypothetical protein JZ751_013879 [Albula glossodonta]